MTSKRINTDVPYIPPHIPLENCLVQAVHSGNAKAVFVVYKGVVYNAHSGTTMDLSRPWRMNDTIRRTYCKLAGIKLSDLKAQIKADQAKAIAEEEKSELESHIRTLRRAGYTVTNKVKA